MRRKRKRDENGFCPPYSCSAAHNTPLPLARTGHADTIALITCRDAERRRERSMQQQKSERAVDARIGYTSSHAGEALFRHETIRMPRPPSPAPPPPAGQGEKKRKPRVENPLVRRPQVASFPTRVRTPASVLWHTAPSSDDMTKQGSATVLLAEHGKMSRAANAAVAALDAARMPTVELQEGESKRQVAFRTALSSGNWTSYIETIGNLLDEAIAGKPRQSLRATRICGRLFPRTLKH